MSPNDLLASLNEHGAALHKSVCEMYRCPIKLVVFEQEQAFKGYSNVLDTGQPYISVNLTALAPASVLVHELFHLQLRAEGVPSTIRLVNPKSCILDERSANLVWKITEAVRSFVEHAMFFGPIRDMGYDQLPQFTQFMQELLHKGATTEICHPTQQSLVVARILLEAGDEQLSTRLFASFPTERVKLGERIAEAVRSEPLGNGDEMAACVVRVVDMVISDFGARATLRGWEERQTGQFVDRVAVVRIELIGRTELMVGVGA